MIGKKYIERAYKDLEVTNDFLTASPKQGEIDGAQFRGELYDLLDGIKFLAEKIKLKIK